MPADLSRQDIDLILEAIDAEIAGAPEGDELRAYFQGSQIFWDLSIADEDQGYAARALRAIAEKYELPMGTAT
jgi:hypothetical protein